MPFDWLVIPELEDYDEAKAAALTGLQKAAEEPLFYEALAWQNLILAEQMAKGAFVTGRRRRYRRRSLVGYLSRYCAKNDTIGFFGPSVWGDWSTSTSVSAAGRPPRRRDVYVELWAVRALARRLRERHELDDWVALQVTQSVRVGAEQVLLPDGSALTLTPLGRMILQACDGVMLAGELPLRLLDESAEQIRAEVRRLQMAGVLTSEFAVRQARHPERQLRGQLMRVGDPGRRAAALGDLAEVVDAVAALGGSAGDPEELIAGFKRADEVFERVTGGPSQHSAGQYYAGKRLAYEDCIADLDAHLGQDVLDRTAPVLELLLTSARWFSHAVSQAYDGLARQVIQDAGGSTAEGLPYSVLLAQMAGSFYDDRNRPVDVAARELRRRWTEVLAVDEAQVLVTRTVADLRAAVEVAFGATGAAWSDARWHSPDLMIASPSLADLQQGRFQVVLGELHPCCNTLNALLFLDTAPDQGQVRSWIDTGSESTIQPVYPYDFGHVNSRTSPPNAQLSASSRYIGLGMEASYLPGDASVVPVAGLRVHLHADELRVRSPDGTFDEPLTAVLGDYLSTAACQEFGLLEPQAHQPRVVIDNVVVSRETWRFAFEELPPAKTDLPDLFTWAQELRREHDIPRYVFVRVAGEVKPVFVDLANPLMLDFLWSKVRRGRERVPHGDLSVTEMLPGPDEMWLLDAQSRRYSVEFRIVTRDRNEHV
jgi:hypothetical protein